MRYKIPAGSESDENLLRETYVDIYSSPETGVGIDEAVVSGVSKLRAYYTQEGGSFEYDYTVEIGTNHNEVYIEDETYYVDGKRHTRQVPKNKTVMQWQTFTGRENTDTALWRCIGIKGDDDFHGTLEDLEQEDAYLSALTGSKLAVKADADEPLWTTEDIKEVLRADCEAQAEAVIEAKIRTKYNGDGYRNCSLKQTDATLVTLNELEMQLRQIAFLKEGCDPVVANYLGFGAPRFANLNTVSSEISEFWNPINAACNDEQKAYVESAGGKKMAHTRKLVIGLWGAAALSLLLLPSVIPFVAALIIAVACVVGSYVLAKVNNPVTSHNYQHGIFKKYDAKRYEFYRPLQAKKLELLEKRFAAMNWQPLTDEEKARFDLTEEQNKELTDKHVPNLRARYERSVVNFPIGELHPNTNKKDKKK